MKMALCGLAVIVIFGAAGTGLAAADDAKVLLGTWNGKAAGPDGGPPTGEIRVVFESGAEGEIAGKFIVKAGENFEYAGEVGKISLEKGMFAATAVFKLGENPLEVPITGPLKGRAIEGTFTVFSKGQKLGEGTFQITKARP